MSQKLNAAIAVIGIDIGKNSFHVAGHDHRGARRTRDDIQQDIMTPFPSARADIRSGVHFPDLGGRSRRSGLPRRSGR